MRILIAFLIVPVLAVAQSFPTEWPKDAQALAPDALRERLLGKTFLAKSVTGADVRTQYQQTYVYINTGTTTDSGTWRTEGSAVCAEWKKLRAACSEIRAVGDALYVKRANNGEIMAMVPQ